MPSGRCTTGTECELAENMRIQCRVCGNAFPALDMYFCPKCGRPNEQTPFNNTLEVTYDYERIADRLRTSDISARVSSIWRFRELLPLARSEAIVSLGEGFTPLRHCGNLGRYLGLKELYVKDESVNPTGCHKDREASILTSKALEWGRHTISAFTCGNLGASLAAYSAKAGLRCVIFIPYTNIYPVPRVAQMSAFGAKLYQISGVEADLVSFARSLHDAHGWVFPIIGGGVRWEGMPQTPYAHEGKKTIALEIIEQLCWKYPDHMISCGAGGSFYDSWKAVLEVQKLNWAKGNLPQMHSAESTNANPAFRAFSEGKQFTILEEIASTLAYPIGNAVSPLKSLWALTESKGSAMCVSDTQLVEAQRLLAGKEGVFVEPASAASVAALQDLVHGGLIDKDETVVCIVTATGLKYPESITGGAPQLPMLKPEIDSLKREGLL